MKKRLITIGSILFLIFTVIITASVVDTTPKWETATGGTYVVTFADYDGTILKEVTCTVGEACVIVPPASPDNKDNCEFIRWNLWQDHWSEIDGDVTIKAIYTLDNRLAVIGGRPIVFYSVFIMLGIMLALLFGLKEAKRTGLDRDALTDGFLWIVPLAILGSRLWYVAFEWESFVYGGFFPSLLRILGFQSGQLDFSSFGLSGLAIHGAFTTALVGGLIFVKVRKLSPWKVLDLIAAGFLFAQTFGRWGNFLNQEAHGGLVGGLTGGLSLEQQYNFLRYTLHIPEFIANNMYMVANGGTAAVNGYYHPTFLYELLLNWIGFGVLLILRRIKNVRFGEMMPFYLVWYGGVRIFIETMRTDPLIGEIFGITFKAAIMTSSLMILGGIALDLLIRFVFKTGFYGDVPGAFGNEPQDEPPAEAPAEPQAPTDAAV